MTAIPKPVLDIIEGRREDLPRQKVIAYQKLAKDRFGWEGEIWDGWSGVSTGVASASRAGKSCCGRKSGTRRIRHVMSFAQAAIRFIGDGMKTVSNEERQRRINICNACPMKSGNRCGICTCDLAAKAAMRLEQCPVSKWLPVLRDRRALGVPTRNLAYFVLPIDRNDMWQWNLRQLKQRWHLFTGSKSLAVSVGSGQSHARRRISTLSINEVLEYSKQLGLEWDHVREFSNNPKLGEVAAFPWLLENSQGGDLTFYAHAKGVTHHGEPNIQKWTEWMYHALLDDWSSVQNALELFSMCGAFRLYGQFKTPGNNRWHYNGTFYWFRNDDVFSRNWQHIDQKYYGTEAWPGLQFTADECACIVKEDPGSLYDDVSWKRLAPHLEDWDEARD